MTAKRENWWRDYAKRNFNRKELGLLPLVGEETNVLKMVVLTSECRLHLL